MLEDFSESGCLDVDAHLSSVRTSVSFSQLVCSDADSHNPVLCSHLHVDVCEFERTARQHSGAVNVCAAQVTSPITCTTSG